MKSRDAIRKLHEDGWYHVKTTGDHWHFKHPIKPGKVTVTHPKKDLSRLVMKSIEKQAGIKLT